MANAKAQRKLREKVEGDYRTIQSKADVMVSHFIDHVWKKKKLNLERDYKRLKINHQKKKQQKKNGNCCDE